MALCRSSSNVLAEGPCDCANKSKSMLSRRKFVCRAHFKLGNLNPGETADLWLDINVPKKSGSEEKGRERRRDKVLGFFMGAKGKQEREVEDCRVHIQAYIPLTLPCFINIVIGTIGTVPEPILIMAMSTSCCGCTGFWPDAVLLCVPKERQSIVACWQC